MKHILRLMLSVGLLMAQQPRIDPVSITATYDIAKDASIILPPVSIKNPSDTPYEYTTSINSHHPNIIIWPVQGVVPPGTNQLVRITSIVVGNSVVGNYNIPITFIRVSPKTFVDASIMTLNINLNIVNSKI